MEKELAIALKAALKDMGIFKSDILTSEGFPIESETEVEIIIREIHIKVK